MTQGHIGDAHSLKKRLPQLNSELNHNSQISVTVCGSSNFCESAVHTDWPACRAV